MKISAKVDYALQAIVEIASISQKDSLISTKEISRKRNIPEKFLEGILTSLCNSGVVNSYRGPSGGFELAKKPEDVFVADIIRIIDGPLASIRGVAPEEIEYTGAVKHISEVWIATRVALRNVLENISIAEILTGKFDANISEILYEKGAWKRRRGNI